MAAPPRFVPVSRSLRRRSVRLSAVVAGAALVCCAASVAVAPARSEAPPLRVGFVAENGGDSPVQRMILAGLVRAQKQLGIELRVLAPGPREGYSPSLAAFAREGYDLVIGFGYLEQGPLAHAARAYPRTRFAIVDVGNADLPGHPSNVEGLVFREQEVGYLAGYLAGLVEHGRPRRPVSTVGGFPIPPIEHFIAGFQAGVGAADPRIRTLNAYANSVSDPAVCSRVASTQIAAGTRAIFAVAGDCGVGALREAKKHHAWGIGVDTDQSALGPFILTSAIKRFDVAVFDAIRALQQHRFATGGDRVYGLRNDGVALGRISSRVPRALVRKVERVRREIASGSIRDIPVTLGP